MRDPSNAFEILIECGAYSKDLKRSPCNVSIGDYYCV